jgi:hypothetical protein
MKKLLSMLFVFAFTAGYVASQEASLPENEAQVAPPPP